MTNQNRLRSKRNGTATHRNGAAVVEAALMLPLLIIVTFGSIDVAQYINAGQVISNCSREGARVASRKSTTNTSDVKNAVLDYLADVFPQLSEEELEDSVIVTTAKTSNSQISNGNLASIESGETLRLNVEFDFEYVRWLPGPLYSKLSTQTYFRRE